MAIRRNSYYADPGLAAAFDNLSEVFKTPSGSDILGYTKAGAEREKAARLAWLFENPNDPHFDRKNIAVGNYTPIQSFYAQNQNDSTTRRNADVSAKATTDVANIQQAGALARQYAQPVVLGDGQVAVLPAQTAAATGLPAQFRGNVTVGQGQVATTPTGETFKGPAKPPTDAEVRGAIIQGLPAAEQRAVAMQGVGVTNVVGGDGKPVVEFTPNAAGKPAYVKDTSKPTIANYKTADGKVGTAALGDNGKWADTQTGVELPAGSQTYTANLQGDKNATGLGTTTNNNIDQQLVDLALTEQTSKRLRNIVSSNPAVQGLAGHIRGTVQDVLQAGGEVGQLFGQNLESVKRDIAAGRVDPKVAEKFTNYDPNIPATAMLETLLTAQVAKILDPDGRISNDRYEQVRKALGAGGAFGNTAKTIATLDELDRVMAGRRNILAPVRPDAAKIGQQPGIPAGTPPAVRTWNPTTGQLE